MEQINAAKDLNSYLASHLRSDPTSTKLHKRRHSCLMPIISVLFAIPNVGCIIFTDRIFMFECEIIYFKYTLELHSALGAHNFQLNKAWNCFIPSKLERKNKKTKWKLYIIICKRKNKLSFYSTTTWIYRLPCTTNHNLEWYNLLYEIQNKITTFNRVYLSQFTSSINVLS